MVSMFTSDYVNTETILHFFTGTYNRSGHAGKQVSFHGYRLDVITNAMKAQFQSKKHFSH